MCGAGSEETNTAEAPNDISPKRKYSLQYSSTNYQLKEIGLYSDVVLMFIFERSKSEHRILVPIMTMFNVFCSSV